MTERLPINSGYQIEFNGTHVNIKLTDNETLSERLSQYYHNHTLIDIDDEDSLPYPARHVLLESSRQEDLSTFTVNGAVSFRPTSLDNTLELWPAQFLGSLSEKIQSYTYDIFEQPHDPNSIYITLDSLHCVRINSSSSATECHIHIDLELIDKIKDATHTQPPSPYSDDTLSPVVKLNHIVTLLGVSLDQLRDSYGYPPKHHKVYTLDQYALPEELTREQQHQVRSGEVDDSEPSENKGLEQVGGAIHAKERLKELASIINYPQDAARFDISPSHFLLHGPPGTGKSSLVEAFGEEINAPVWQVSSADIVDKYVGESGKKITDIFNKAKAVPGNIVVFFEEFDTLANKNSHGSGERTDVKKILNTQLEDITKNHPNIVIAATTNSDLDDLEPSLIRSGRLESIGVPLPNEEERYDIFALILFKSIQRTAPNEEFLFNEAGEQMTGSDFRLYDYNLNLKEIVEKTNGMTGADFEVILQRARKKQFLHFVRTGESLSVTQQDLLREINHFGR